ncbi:MAG TPA: hypothetical protein PK440_06870 [Candidatus Accumulibacter phosphatis]|nr:hypothetical protein [Candidatus Accumulibacter phosphatis]HRQ94708.1 hypothetical protein [Candidatus Accumulibacter phosphatis]
MEALLLWLGRAVGSIGLLISIVVVATRLAGKHYLAGFELLTLLQGGMAAVVGGCFLLLVALSGRGRAGGRFRD